MENFTSDHDEPECRVCRGPPELPDSPLLRACKCSGSIGWIHQECLQHWLDVMVRRGSGNQRKCELCKYAFQFEPYYAEDAPEHLTKGQFVYGVSRRAFVKWMPIFVKVTICLFLWLGVMPLLSAHLYLSWMRSPALLLQRLTYDMMKQDWAAGLVVAALIIISFLCLMNFADFVRMEMQPLAIERRRLLQVMQRAAGHRAVGQDDDRREQPPPEERIDNELCNQAQQQEGIRTRARRNMVGRYSLDRPVSDYATDMDVVLMNAGGDFDDDDDDDDDESYAQEDDDDDDPSADIESDDEDVGDDGADHFDMNNARMQEFIEQMRERRPGVHIEVRLDAGVNDNNRLLNGQAALPAPALNDGGDLGIQEALDEILGLRGPVFIVLRNMLWLLTFNTLFLLLFVFTPRMVGKMANYLFLKLISSNFTPQVSTNVTDTLQSLNTSSALEIDWHSIITNISSPMDLLRAVETHSEVTKAPFRLSDISNVLSGYLVCAFVVVFSHFFWLAMTRFRWMRRAEEEANAAEMRQNIDMEEMRVAFDAFNRVLDGAAEQAEVGENRPIVDGEEDVAIVFVIRVSLKAITSVVKVGVLLLLKMFVLPVALGLYLDAVTMSLIGATLDQRIQFAGSDLFSFTLLHWVAGITFMLLVTVSVLQLREVMHPEILANVVRPQEPQPDLLGNLMHEAFTKHMKRMVLSLFLYACLLSMHVYVPVRFLTWAGYQPRLNFSFLLMPRVQIPLELIFFHLCMLGLLEKNKNIIGELQHHWLKFIGGILRMKECILPHVVPRFRFYGNRNIYFADSTIDPFWQKLAKCKYKQREEILEKGSDGFMLSETNVFRPSAIRLDGKRVLKPDFDYIRLPLRIPVRAERCRSLLLPTSIGRYRLSRTQNLERDVIEVWEESTGEAIPRPPEGWDDLGAGGAFEQGRWSWTLEKKSEIENGVARRTPFFQTQRSMVVAIFKLAFMAIASWAATSVLVGLIALSPLVIGRWLLYIARLSDTWAHDPFAYALGSLFFFPMFNYVFHGFVGDRRTPFARRFSRGLCQLSLFPAHKTMTLCASAALFFGLSPLLLGSIIDVGVIKPKAWFMGAEPWVDQKDIVLDWLLGAVLLFVWVQFCRFGFVARHIWAFFTLAPPNRAAIVVNGGAQPHAPAMDDGNEPLNGAWLGEFGRTTHFVAIWKAALLDFEYDKIDSAVLLDDFCFPLIRGLFSTLFWPLGCLGVIHLCAPTTSALFRALIVRCSILLTIAHKTSPFWLEPAKKLLKAAHKSARDDLFLLGERLMTYGG
ncbi:hypothetical protein MPSEU_000281100 [Mayamaea pseudoterrestris]|nr:hypothetical protein MPSEU_000281100 [Mayamaea pseudoterrestris]